MKILKTGDPCPCCGKPIQSRDNDVLMMLSWVADKRRLPTPEEAVGFYSMLHPEVSDHGDSI